MRKTKKCGICIAINRHYKSEIPDEVFNIFSKEINVNGSVCDPLEKYFNFLNENEKQDANEFNLN